MKEASPAEPKKRPRGRMLALTVILVLVVAGGFIYWWQTRYEVSTDDAYVACQLARIAPRVSGRVAAVLVSDNWAVEAGQPLVQLDPADYQVAVQEAEAALKRVTDEVTARYAQVEEARAQIRKATAQLNKARTDLRRYSGLYERQTVPREVFDRVNTGFKVGSAELAAAEAEYQRALAAIGGSTAIPLNEQPAIKEAAARLAQARLNLEYTVITAPLAGFVTKKAVQVGDWVNRGQTLMALAPPQGPAYYIEANFKETQLTHVRLGQPVEIEVDTYPGAPLQGKVDSIMGGTGGAFALLPPENATGNWVKVVQRIPVKVVLTQLTPADRPLRVGMSVTAKVDTRDRGGPLLLSPAGGGGQGMPPPAPSPGTPTPNP